MIFRAPKIKLIFEFVSVFRLVFSCFTAPGPRKTQKTQKKNQKTQKNQKTFFLKRLKVHELKN